MELLFIIVIAASIGMIARYSLPQRRTYGAFLVPAFATVAATIVWVALLWAGQTFDGGWIWVASITAAVAASLFAALALPKRRKQADAHLLSQLTGAKA